MTIPKIKLRLGKTRVSRPVYPSEAGFVASINQQLAQMEANLRDLFDQVTEVSVPVMVQALEPTKVLAEYYTPKKTGKLVNSSYLEATSKGRNPRVELGFAKGGDPDYAVYVHEMVEIPHAEPTRSKFLQAALTEDLPNIYQRLVDGYAEAFRGE